MSRYAITGIAHFKFMLVLNPMRQRREEVLQFGPYDSREDAIAAHDNELVARYAGKGLDVPTGRVKLFSKSFREGGDFEWCNPLTKEELAEPNVWGHGIHAILSQVTDIVALYPMPVGSAAQER